MATSNPNPFVLPGFGQAGEMGANPLLASMEMMRKAWEGMSGAAMPGAPLAGAALSPEDFERRIAELRTVENWLRMNLSMLGSTIQAMEVQRATIATLRAFVDSAGSMARASAADAAGFASVSGDSSGLFESDVAASETTAADAPPDSQEGDAAPANPAQAAMHAWWDMLQSQFDTIATAAAATGAVSPAPGTDAEKKAGKPAAAKKTPARKPAARKAAAKKTAARKSSAS